MAFLVLGGVTLWVWQLQIDHRREVLARHTQDIGAQAAIRLQTFVESHLGVAHIFAQRWSTHETHDFSDLRFERFAAVLLEELPGYHAIGLIPADSTRGIVVPADSEIMSSIGSSEHQVVLAEALRENTPVLSAPYVDEHGVESVFAALPLSSEEQFLGHLVVKFHTETLIRNCFHERIQSEFHFMVRDDGEELFRSATEANTRLFDSLSPVASIYFPVNNRTWELSIVPQARESGMIERKVDLAVPVLGIVLSFGLALVIYQLLRRMRLFRQAHFSALREVAERKRTERALRASEVRYHSVFASATDGLMLLETDGTILEVNAAGGAMLGYSPEKTAGMPVRDFLAPAHRRKFDEFMSQLQQEVTARLDSVELRGDDGLLIVDVRGTRIIQETIPRLLVVVTDVTAHKEATERLTLLSRKVIVAQEDERERLSRELHDEIGQILTALQLEMAAIAKRLGKWSEESIPFSFTSSLVEDATERLRRIWLGLRPPVLDDLGLEPAAVELIEDFSERSGIDIDFTVQLDEHDKPLPREIALSTYRVIQEALNNTMRHANATSVRVSIRRDGDGLITEVQDDGEGFDPCSSQVIEGCGLQGMRERALLVGGTVSIESALGEGCIVILTVEQSEPTEE